MTTRKNKKSNKSNKKSNKLFRKTRSKRQRGGISEEQKEKDDFLFKAIEYDNADDVKNALNNGANVNANKSGITVLMNACDYKFPEIVKILLDKKYGVDVNATDNNGDTALMKAIDCNMGTPWGQVEYDIENMVQMLLDADADINVKNKDGKTALEIAKETGCTKPILLPLNQLIQRNKEKQTLNKIATKQLYATPTTKKEGVTKQVLGQAVQNRQGKIIGHPLADKISSYLGGKRKTRKSKKSKK